MKGSPTAAAPQHHTSPANTRNKAAMWLLVCYVMALIAGFYSLEALATLRPGWHPLWRLFLADLVSTLVVFGFSLGHRNASFYDPYWSVAPPLLGLWIWQVHGTEQGIFLRQWLALGLVMLWACRLTWSWWRGWTGLQHEDWRYGMLRERTGRLYPLVNLMGIHVFPTAQVFLGCLPLWAALGSSRPMGWLDSLAVLITTLAIWIEARADRTLHDFRRGPRTPGQILDVGVWSWSRHPNYLGEIGFWLGLALLGFASGGDPWLCFGGFFCITVMFVGVSIPMLDRRSLERRPGYAAHMAKVPGLLPWLPRSAPDHRSGGN